MPPASKAHKYGQCRKVYMMKPVTLIFFSSGDGQNERRRAWKSVMQLGLSKSWLEPTPRICSAQEGGNRSLEVPHIELRSWRQSLVAKQLRQLEG